MKRNIYYIWLSGLITILLIGCKSKPDKTEVEILLDVACENSSELLQVLNHFEKDTLKYSAALFLIRNMIYHHYYDGPDLAVYYKYFEVQSQDKFYPQQVLDFVHTRYGEFNKKSLQFKPDIKNISAQFLIENIEWAFKVREEQPWSKNVSFDDFCEYVLPYRIADEKIFEWRKDVYLQFNILLKDICHLPDAEDPLFVAQYILNKLSEDRIFFTEIFEGGPHVGPNIIKWRSGSCKELADLVVYILRGLGLPCGIDFMMMRGDNNAPHFWNFVLDKEGQSYYCEFPNAQLFPATYLWNPKGKVYRQTYSLNQDIFLNLNKKIQKIHPVFRKPLFIDVTNFYAGEHSLNLSLPKNLLYTSVSRNEPIYLCSSVRQEWTPLDWTYCRNKTIEFKNIEGNVVFRLGTWQRDSLILISDPFWLDKFTGEIRFFKSTDKKESISIFFKYHLYNETFIFKMPNGVFEGAQTESFYRPDTLHFISEVPTRLRTTIFINTTKKYKYFRYLGPVDSFCNIAEIEVYEQPNDLTPLKGEIIGTPGCFQHDGSHEYTNVFDGNPYTSFDYFLPYGGWCGLAFETPKQISKIIYTPRNRDNFIRVDDEYELFYWENRQWNSCGLKKAVADSLVYTVPEGVLLYLRNHTRGKDERIFEYRNGQQIFL